MGLIVQKFGGTSVGSVERIRQVAKRVAETRSAGHDLIVVVSAVAGETNRLLALGRELAAEPDSREMDVLVATGEQVSAALLSVALNGMGITARSLLGHQVRITTDSVHTRARIHNVDTGQLLTYVRAGNVVVVAGFQGVDECGNITTLGRGGSDTTAVAITVAVQADLCEIYTDVEGVFTADPNVCSDARKIRRISYEEMLELSSLGAKVLQIRCVELAMKYRVPVHVRSSFSNAEGTMLVPEDKSLESVVVAGIACDKNEAKVTVRAVPDQPGVVASIFESLAGDHIAVDMIIQNFAQNGMTDLTFTVSRDDVQRARALAADAALRIGASGQVLVDEEFAKVSIVGLGMRSHAGVAARMFRILADVGINIAAISTSEIKTSCLIHRSRADDALRALHQGFGLGSSVEALEKTDTDESLRRVGM